MAGRSAKTIRGDLTLKLFHDLLLDSGTIPPAAVRKEFPARLTPAATG